MRHRDTGAGTQAAGIALPCAGSVVTIFFFVRFNDRSDRNRRVMWASVRYGKASPTGPSGVPFTVPVVIANIVLFGVGAALAGEPT